MIKLSTFALALAACGGPAGDTGGDDDVAVDASVATHHGFVTLQQYDGTVGGAPDLGGSIGASFAPRPECTSQPTGPCVYTKCGPAATGYQSAGAITIAGLRSPVTLTPGAMNKYGAYSATAALYGSGEHATVSASGADVGAFTATLTTPRRATATSPIVGDNDTLAIPRAHDFTATWTATPDPIMVDVVGADGDALSCRFDGSAGSGTVPASALAMLSPGRGGYETFALTDTVVTAGDWDVTIRSYFLADWPDGSLAVGSAVLQ